MSAQVFFSRYKRCLSEGVHPFASCFRGMSLALHPPREGTDDRKGRPDLSNAAHHEKTSTNRGAQQTNTASHNTHAPDNKNIIKVGRPG